MSMSMTLLRKGPWWLGLAVMFMGAVCIYASTELPATAQYAAVGPGMFVIGVGLGLVGLGVLLLVQIARGEVFEPDEAENAVPGQAMDKRAFFTALLAAIVPALTIKIWGLRVRASFCFSLLAALFGPRVFFSVFLLGFVWGGACCFFLGWLACH